MDMETKRNFDDASTIDITNSLTSAETKKEGSERKQPRKAERQVAVFLTSAEETTSNLKGYNKNRKNLCIK